MAAKKPAKTAAKKSAPKAAPKAAAKTSAPAPAAAPVPAPAAASAATASAVGFFDVPTIEKAPWGILGLIFNIIPGGVGTIIAGAKTSAMGQIVKGIIQFLLVWTVIVWVWSVIDGVRIFKRSTA